MRNEFNFRWANPVKIRSCKYLNNVVEQDHRRVKFRVTPMLGLNTFYNARRVLIGIELTQKIMKSQFRVPAHFGRDFASIGKLYSHPDDWTCSLTQQSHPTHRIPNSAKLFYLMCCLSDILCEGQSRIGARRESENETNQFASTISRDDTNRLHRRGLQQPRRLVSLARRIRPPCGGAFNSVTITSRKVNRTRSLLFSDQAREPSTSRSAALSRWAVNNNVNGTLRKS